MFTNRFYATIIDLLIHLRITIFYTSRRVGIGRRDRLKICCPQGRVGSSPTAGIETGILSGGFPFFAVCFRPRPLGWFVDTCPQTTPEVALSQPYLPALSLAPISNAFSRSTGNCFSRIALLCASSEYVNIGLKVFSDIFQDGEKLALIHHLFSSFFSLC